MRNYIKIYLPEKKRKKLIMRLQLVLRGYDFVESQQNAKQMYNLFF